MNILELGEIGEFLYCPLTGKPMLGDIEPENVPSVVAFWALEVPDEPVFIRDENLQNLWDRYLADLETSNTEQDEYEQEYPDPEDFLISIEVPNLFCFKVFQTYGGLIVFDSIRAFESQESLEG